MDRIDGVPAPSLPGVDSDDKQDVREDRPGEKYLAGYVVPVVGADRDGLALVVRQFARTLLPDYLVPAVVIVVDALPLTASGKLDQRALPAPDYGGHGSRDPRGLREEILCRLFARVLDLPEVGAEDSFFDLGGHSLLLPRLAAGIRMEFDADLDIRTVFRQPTPAGLARCLGRPDLGRALDVVLPLRPHGNKPALFCVHPATGIGWPFAGLSRHVDHAVYALQARGLAGPEPLPSGIEDIAKDYLAQIRSVRPEGPYHLLGWSFGGLVAHAIATRLQDDGQRVGSLTLVDAYPSSGASRKPVDEQTALTYVTALDPDGDLLDAAARSTVARVFANNLQLAELFVPDRYRGEVLLFTGLETQATGLSSRRPWEPYVDGDIVVYDEPHGHDALFTPSALDRIGPALAKALNRPNL